MKRPYVLKSVLLASVSLMAVGLLTWYGLLAEPDPDPTMYTFTPRAPAAEKKIVTFIAVGDIMLARTVEQKMLQYDDWLYPFRETYHVTSNADLVFGNLEGPLIKGPLVNAYEMSFRADPQAIDGLLFGGFDVLSLANNHINNKGREGINNTIETLNRAGILHTGAGLNVAEAAKPATVEVNGTSFGFLAFTDGTFTSQSDQAADERAGALFLNEQTLTASILKLKDTVDVIIVSMHAGTEYQHEPEEYQVQLAHTAIDSGAELVIGHHPHVVQPIEEYNGGLILYSLGNFIFDQMWSQETTEGAIVSITFTNANIVEHKIIPIKIVDYCQPKILSNEDGEHIIDRMSNFTF